MRGSYLDSKAVNVAIRKQIRPPLSEAGFVRSSGRTFWRDHPDRIDVVNFQSFNRYHAGALGVTTYSFAVNIGCLLRYLPSQHADASGSERLKSDRPEPKEFDCQMRGRLNRGYPDPTCTDMKIWSIDPVGANLDRAIQDTCHVLAVHGLPWFDQFNSPRAVYDILATREEDMGGLWGFGRPASPLRSYFLGYAARAAGLHAEAEKNLLHAADTPSFESIRERLLADARSAR